MTDHVKEFYDSFLDHRMVGYRVDGNLRIEKAIEFVRERVTGGETVVDVGCGIGILTEAVARHRPEAKVIGIDISPANVAFAAATSGCDNLVFKSASVTEQMQAVRDEANGPVDIFCMIDVIEHIPEAARPQVFADLAEASSDDASLLLTYPSPEFQRHLQQNDPAELQVIDNVVEIGQLMQEAAGAGWILRSFTYVDVWRRNQYVHVHFVRTLPEDRVQRKKGLFSRTTGWLDRKFTRPRRVKRFSDIARRIRGE